MGYQDPLDVAQQWLYEKPERDKAQEALRKARQAEEDVAHAKDDPNTLYPSSPLYFRAGGYGDLQPVSGVYPTPPDGVMPQGLGVSASGDIPNISGPIGSMDRVLSQESNQRPSELPGIPEADGTPHLDIPGGSPTIQHPFDSQTDMHFDTSLHTNDDLFEDLDADTFDGNGVTDADFNFFDEPDGDDFGDMDGVAQSNEEEKPEDTSHNQEANNAGLEQHTKTNPTSPPTIQTGSTTDRNLDLRPGKRLQSEPHQQSDPGAMIEDANAQILSADEPITQSPEQEGHELSPPLSPRLIKQKLLPPSAHDQAAPSPQQPLQPRRKESIFDPVNFNQKMSLSDSKYTGGRFHVPTPEGENPSSSTPRKPKTPSSKAQGNVLNSGPPYKAASQRFSALIDLRGSLGRSSRNPAGSILGAEIGLDEGDISDTSSGDLGSEPDSQPANLDPLPIAPTWPVKRKWIADEISTPLSATSFAESKIGGDGSEHMLGQPALQTDQACLLSLESSPWDWSLVNLPPPVERRVPIPRADMSFPSPGQSPVPTALSRIENSPSELSGKDTIAVAQILTDQIVSSTLDILSEDKTFGSGLGSDQPLEVGDALDPTKTVQNTIRQMFDKVVDCDVSRFVCVQDVFPDIQQAGKGHQPKALPRRMNTYGQGDGSGSAGHLIYSVAPPHIRVRRADALWDLLPTALSFWEPLGLAPTSGSKNIITYCVYPYSESLGARVDTFLNNLGIVYEGCKLGTHVRSDAIEDFQGGLVPTRMTGPVSKRNALQTLRETCRRLGDELSQSYLDMREKDDNSKIDAFVIYMVDPFAEPTALWELCSAFWSLFGAYGQGAQAHAPRPDVVLQIVPMKYIASFDAPVVLEPSTLMSLAREVYDRCPPNALNPDKTPLSIFSAPSIQLEEALPRSIQFKLASDPPADLLRENSYMHLAYAISLDGAWITVAWTDSCGKSQAVVSYSSKGRAFNEIAREIWQTTIEVLHSRRVTWRICIAKAGVMEREEIEGTSFPHPVPNMANPYPSMDPPRLFPHPT
jgi:mediator of RNA polymerase II transcription subunit 13